MYITIPKDNNDSFYELNHWYDLNSSNTDSPSLDVVFSLNGKKEEAPGLSTAQTNATMSIRGRSNRVAPQKSYKIKLKDSAGLWKGQRTLNLNKHSYDMTRVRNKLSFDMFKNIPDIASFRTTFVHLYVKDETEGNALSEFKDYGLYTHIEQGNERYLAARGLDPNGQLYKAENFEFFRYPDEIKMADNEGYDKKLFEQRLEIHGSEDHQKLIEMLEDVNDYKMPINDVIDKHFDRDNYETWLAVNLLMDNTDVVSQNFYLYSPLNDNKWYFIPWDYDAAWGWEDEESSIEFPDWEDGIGLFWGVSLHNRFLKDQRNVESLSAKMEELSKIINEENTKEYLTTYRKIVEPFIQRQPDVNFLPMKAESFSKAFDALAAVPTREYQDYLDSLENPMPFFLNAANVSAGGITLTWEHSYDLQMDDLSYTVEISNNPDFQNPLVKKEQLRAASFSTETLPAGIYYWKVIAYDSKGNSQKAFDAYEDDDGNIYHGVQAFRVE
ncbi:CotH kinase family protein [Mesobacillus subterraneus]|uniref:CotH kinase family protein n=1 Tax=Mesobacillus subterraneus TaxID=285983 RepID=UPI00273DDF3D|nr:CotH kinase family protein [Mesobacillus subterraneus]WLR54465.1 CotH kinase family protein [Mesobacillus subterraneus]